MSQREDALVFSILYNGIESSARRILAPVSTAWQRRRGAPATGQDGAGSSQYARGALINNSTRAIPAAARLDAQI